MKTMTYKCHVIRQNSGRRFYVNRFNDPIEGVVMFTDLQRAMSYIDKRGAV